MTNREDFYMIHQLRQEDCFLVDIADEMNCSVKTVQLQLKREQPPSLRKRTVHKPRKLDPFKSTVDDMLVNNIWNAMVIFDRVVSLGDIGKISLLREYIHPKRALRPSQATVRYETDAGFQLQHDWGELAVEVGGEPCKIYISVNTLGYSRRFFVYTVYSNDCRAHL